MAAVIVIRAEYGASWSPVRLDSNDLHFPRAHFALPFQQ